MNSFLENIESDLPRQVYIAGFRTIVIDQKYIAETGSYLTNATESMNELFFNGTLYGTIEPLMAGATIPELSAELQQKAGKINAILTINNQNLTITQSDPWNVQFTLTTEFRLADEQGLVSWNRTIISSANVSVEGFEDPFYTLNTQNQVVNIISKTNYTSFVSGSDISNLYAHTVNSYYLATPLAPSYLDRLEGKTTPNAQGIESLVNLQRLSSAGLTVSQKSVVDHIYFSAQNPQAHRITGMPSWFYLDDAHLNTYEASGLAQ